MDVFTIRLCVIVLGVVCWTATIGIVALEVLGLPPSQNLTPIACTALGTIGGVLVTPRGRNPDAAS